LRRRGRSGFRKLRGRACGNARSGQAGAEVAVRVRFLGPTWPLWKLGPRYRDATPLPSGLAETARRKRPPRAAGTAIPAELPPTDWTASPWRKTAVYRFCPPRQENLPPKVKYAPLTLRISAVSLEASASLNSQRPQGTPAVPIPIDARNGQWFPGPRSQSNFRGHDRRQLLGGSRVSYVLPVARRAMGHTPCGRQMSRIALTRRPGPPGLLSSCSVSALGRLCRSRHAARTEHADKRASQR